MARSKGDERKQAMEMEGHHPLETVVRAFCLFMDYVPPREAAEVLGVSVHTVENWYRRSSMEVDGHKLFWSEIRDIGEAKRALVSSERELANVKRFEWDVYAEKFAEDAAQDLQEARKYIMEAVEGGKAKAEIKDLPKIIEAEHLVQGKATKIIETQKNVAIIVGKIVSHVAGQVISNEREREIFLDRIGEDFARVIASGSDERAVQKVLSG